MYTKLLLSKQGESVRKAHHDEASLVHCVHQRLRLMDYRIVISKTAADMEKHAAEELQKFLTKNKAERFYIL